jgi:hypothetical protein
MDFAGRSNPTAPGRMLEPTAAIRDRRQRGEPHYPAIHGIGMPVGRPSE